MEYITIDTQIRCVHDAIEDTHAEREKLNRGADFSGELTSQYQAHLNRRAEGLKAAAKTLESVRQLRGVLAIDPTSPGQ
jgi:hypothetical protein